MKLIQEYLIKICIAIFLLAFLMELYILFLLNNRSQNIWKKIYDENMEKSEQKSIGLTEKIKKYMDSVMSKYYIDVKLIGKHIQLLNREKNSTYENSINKNSSIFNEKNNNKAILIAEIGELNKEEYMRKIFDKSTQTYNYNNYYEKKFKNYNNNNELLRDLLSDSHKELNSIGFYSFVNNRKVFNQEEEINIKYIISILKTIFIKRYLRKRKNLDYTRIYILNKEEIYIYPPEAYHNTYLFQFEKVPFLNCSDPFPLCIYNYISNNLIDKVNNRIFFIHEIILYEKMIASICIKISFIKNNQNQVFLCLEADHFTLWNAANFSIPKKIDFGVLAVEQNRVMPIIFNKNKYKNITGIFSGFELEELSLSETRYIQVISFFHFLYYNLVSYSKEHPKLTVNFSELKDEYNILHYKIIAEINEYIKNKKRNYFIIPFNKTICQKGLLNNSYYCIKDDFKLIIAPITFPAYILNEDLIENNVENDIDFSAYIYTIFSSNNITTNERINTLLDIKIQRTIILFLCMTIIIFFFLIIIINFISEYSLNKIINISQELTSAEITSNFRNFLSLPENEISAPNKEMALLKRIYEIMRRSIIIKQVFNDETYLDKHSIEFFNLVQNLNKKDIKEICNSYIGFYHFKNEAYNIAENEFRSTILFIEERENKIVSYKDKEFDDKIKDAIKRSSTVSYINEYSLFEKIDENILQIIKLKINKQRFIYLYAMTKFKLGSELINNDNSNTGSVNNTVTMGNKTKLKKEKEKMKQYFKDSIKYFTECKNINISLGINQIKIIYSLIMISKAYIQLNEYRNAIININEALNLFFDFSKCFKDNHYKYYNPKIMIFVESNVFQYILYTIERICSIFNKPYASNWINLKIFETSPFLFNNIHTQSGIYTQNFLEKNKIRLNKSEKFTNINYLSKEYEKIKKFYAKIITRMNIKILNKKKYTNIDNKKITDSNYAASNKNKNDEASRKDVFTGRQRQSSFHYKNRNLNKVITLCLSEKILRKINGFELKDVIIKYFQKLFVINENDKFSFIQFAYNGKKTVYIKKEKLNYFLQKIQKINNSFELTESYSRYTNMPFGELFNLLDSIIKNNNLTQEDSITDDTDNIIIMFMNAEDIRFTTMDECLNIVKEMNRKNVSLFFLSYDSEISIEKINNIQSLLCGLIEGYFYQIKNYQQIKQIFINISTIQYQSNFFGYDFHTIDHEL